MIPLIYLIKKDHSNHKNHGNHSSDNDLFERKYRATAGRPYKNLARVSFYLSFLPNMSVAGVGARLPGADIAAWFGLFCF
jgi:hypothetical protein